MIDEIVERGLNSAAALNSAEMDHGIDAAEGAIQALTVKQVGSSRLYVDREAPDIGGRAHQAANRFAARDLHVCA